MKRIKLTVAYDGTHYSGWQIQPNAPTIEKELDTAIYALTGEKLHVTGASRTDAGVHGLGNVAVFDTESTIPGSRFCYALNRYLPEEISILESREVKGDFHPRHCNTKKTYEYKILNTPFPIPQQRNYAWHVPGKLDTVRMREAAALLVGEHDFKSFCCVRTRKRPCGMSMDLKFQSRTPMVQKCLRYGLPETDFYTTWCGLSQEHWFRSVRDS